MPIHRHEGHSFHQRLRDEDPIANAGRQVDDEHTGAIALPNGNSVPIRGLAGAAAPAMILPMRPRHLALLLVTLTACATSPPTAAAPAGQLAHSVFFWFKPDAPADTAHRLLGFYRTEVPRLPGVLAVLPGGPRASAREVVDDSFDLGVTTVFADSDAEHFWHDHPVHKRMIAEFEPYLAKVVVYDTLVAARLAKSR